LVSSESESGDDELLADLKKKVLELESQRGKAKRKAMSPPSNGASRLVAPGSAPVKRPAGNSSLFAAVPQVPQYSYPRDYLSSFSDAAAPNAEEARTQRPNGQGFSYGPPPSNGASRLVAPGSAPLKKPAGNSSRVAAVPQAPQYSYPRDYLSPSSDFAAPNAEEARTQRPNGQGFSYGPPPTNEVAFLKARSNRRLAFKGRTVCWVAPDSPEDSSGFTKGTVVVSVKYGNTENKVLSHEMPFQVYNFSSLN
jgi:hypothetical protein